MINYQDIYNVIVETIADAKDIDANDINEHSTLRELSLDSLDYVELTVLLKKAFSITINFEKVIESTDITINEFCQKILDNQQKGA